MHHGHLDCRPFAARMDFFEKNGSEIQIMWLKQDVDRRYPRKMHEIDNDEFDVVGNNHDSRKRFAFISNVSNYKKCGMISQLNGLSNLTHS